MVARRFCLDIGFGVVGELIPLGLKEAIDDNPTQHNIIHSLSRRNDVKGCTFAKLFSQALIQLFLEAGRLGFS